MTININPAWFRRVGKALVAPAFLRKLLVAFVTGFVVTVGGDLLNIGPTAALGYGHAAWVGALIGAAMAGVRAALVLIPGVNLESTDQSPLTAKPAAVAAAATTAVLALALLLAGAAYGKAAPHLTLTLPTHPTARGYEQFSNGKTYFCDEWMLGIHLVQVCYTITPAKGAA